MAYVTHPSPSPDSIPKTPRGIPPGSTAVLRLQAKFHVSAIIIIIINNIISSISSSSSSSGVAAAAVVVVAVVE